MRETESFSGDRVISKDPWPKRYFDFLPVGPTEGKGLHEQALHHRQPQKKHSPRDCSHSCLHLMCICKFGALCAAVHGHWGWPLSAPYIAVSQGLRYVPTTFDHH
jgi:hypothetical protein